jgi:hypothetical protein
MHEGTLVKLGLLQKQGNSISRGQRREGSVVESMGTFDGSGSE